MSMLDRCQIIQAAQQEKGICTFVQVVWQLLEESIHKHSAAYAAVDASIANTYARQVGWVEKDQVELAKNVGKQVREAELDSYPENRRYSFYVLECDLFDV